MEFDFKFVKIYNGLELDKLKKSIDEEYRKVVLNRLVANYPPFLKDPAIKLSSKRKDKLLLHLELNETQCEYFIKDSFYEINGERLFSENEKAVKPKSQAQIERELIVRRNKLKFQPGISDPSFFREEYLNLYQNDQSLGKFELLRFIRKEDEANFNELIQRGSTLDQIMDEFFSICYQLRED